MVHGSKFKLYTELDKDKYKSMGRLIAFPFLNLPDTYFIPWEAFPYGNELMYLTFLRYLHFYSFHCQKLKICTLSLPWIG